MLYREAGRAELADQENAEIAVINEFLPKQIDKAADHMPQAKAAIASTKGSDSGKSQHRQEFIDQRRAFSAFFIGRRVPPPARPRDRAPTPPPGALSPSLGQ